MKTFEVYNPMAGRWFMLHWWTDDERGHLAFASTEDGLRQMAAGVFKKKPLADVKGIYEVEVVAPSDLMSRLAIKHDQKERVERFFHEMLARVKEAGDVGRPLPLPFARCDKYEPGEGIDDDEWARRDHYGCANCEMTMLLVGMTKDEFYDTFYERWSKLNPEKVYLRRGQPKRVPSTAEKAADDEVLWYAHANFGHHQGGVELHVADLTDAETDRPSCLSERTLFFFRMLREVGGKLASDVAAMAEDAERASRAEEERREAARKKEHTSEKVNRIKMVFDFFGGGGS